MNSLQHLECDSLGRPSWDSWFMTLTFVVAQRSLDKHTKCGCVAVDDSKSILSVGYNSPPRGCIDSDIPTDRPAKYLYMEHSESNAVNNAARCGISLKGSTFYVTGPPCNACFRRIINVGAVRIVHGPILHQRTEEEIESIKIMNNRAAENFSSTRYCAVEMQEMHDMSSVYGLLDQTHEYIVKKLNKQEAIRLEEEA